MWASSRRWYLQYNLCICRACQQWKASTLHFTQLCLTVVIPKDTFKAATMPPSLRGKSYRFCFHSLWPCRAQFYTYLYRVAHAHIHTLTHFQMAEVLWLWAALPQVMRSWRRQNDVFISSRVRQDGGRMESGRGEGKQDAKKGWKDWKELQSRGTEECIWQEGGIMRKNGKRMINDESAGRRQRGGGSLPVNQITNQSFDRGLLWPETWRITFAPTHIPTLADALSIVSTQFVWR